MLLPTLGSMNIQKFWILTLPLWYLTLLPFQGLSFPNCKGSELAKMVFQVLSRLQSTLPED